ncbi:MAG: hypothetical protein WAN22_23585 [Solirubrobacteraceae bacterium]
MIAFVDAVVGAVAAEQGGEGVECVPGDGAAFVDREMPERFDEVRFPASARAADDEDFGTVDPFEGPQRVLCLGRDHRGGRLPGVERLAGRQTRGASAHRDGGVVAAGGLLGQEDAQDLGVFPALAGGGGDHLRRRSANVWHA